MDRPALQPARRLRTPIAHSEQCCAAHNIVGTIEQVQTDHALGNDQSEVLLEALVELSGPVGAAVLLDGRWIEPDLAVSHLGAERGHVVGKGIEGTAAGQIELCMMPVASEDAVLNRAAVQGKAHVGAAIINREYRSLIEKHGHSSAVRRHQFDSVLPQRFE